MNQNMARREPIPQADVEMGVQNPMLTLWVGVQGIDAAQGEVQTTRAPARTRYEKVLRGFKRRFNIIKRVKSIFNNSSDECKRAMELLVFVVIFCTVTRGFLLFCLTFISFNFTVRAIILAGIGVCQCVWPAIVKLPGGLLPFWAYFGAVFIFFTTAVQLVIYCISPAVFAKD